MTRLRLRVVLSCLLGLAVAVDASTAAERGSVLIRNVHIPGRDEGDVDVTVSLLIEGGTLEVVTKDAIARTEAETALDAEGGTLLGTLNLGEPPTFLILDADPREEFDALLDTRLRARFAIRDGTILKNALPPVVDSGSERRGWLAYTPPPVALPVSYRDTSKWNRWETSWISGLFTAAILLDRTYWLAQDDASKEQVEDLKPFEGGSIRGLRFGAVGTFNFASPWVYTLFGATHAFDKGFDVETNDDATLFDYRLDIPLPKRITLSLGKQKEPISMERIMALIHLSMQERTSVSDGLLPSRNVGAVLSGATSRVTWSGGVFNDWFDQNEPFDESSSQVVGRVTGLPFLTEDESHLVHLGVGIRYTNARAGFQSSAGPEFNDAPDYVDTGRLDADHALSYNIELSWRRGPYWVASEYLHTDVAAPDRGDPSFVGYHVTAGWAVTGELRPYNRRGGYFRALPVARSVRQRGPGAWELSARWSDLDLTDGNVAGGEMRIASLGANCFLTPVFHVNANYRHVWLDRRGVTGETDGLMFRVVLMLE